MRFTTLDRLKAWLDRLAQEVDLIAPRDVDGHVLYPEGCFSGRNPL